MLHAAQPKSLMAGFLGMALTLIIATGCGSVDPAGDNAGFSWKNKTQPARTDPVASPTGRIVPDGTMDRLGYRLPLDVVFEDADRPTRRSRSVDRRIKTRRTEQSRPDFEEHRLGPDDGHTQNETSIAAEGATLIAGWNNYDDTTLLMGVARSTDGGHSWDSSILGGHDGMSDPAVKSGGNGRWYYAYLASGGFGGSDVDIFVRRSTDNGESWLNPVDVSQNGSFDDKPYIDSGGDDVLVGWADFGFNPAKIRAVRSTNGGVTFGENHVLSANSVAGNGACPVIDGEGYYFVFWRDSWQDSLWVARSTDSGTSWSPDRGIVDMHPLPSSLPGGFRIVNLPSADADPVTGNLLVVWNDQRFGDPDILAIRSTDGGISWSFPVRVNDDAGSEAQFFPWVAFDENGIAHVVWYDRRHDGYGIDVYYTRSLDGGQTFEENVRVTAAPFDPVLPWDTAIDFIGDYNGVAATGDQVFPFYQDARAGNQDVYVALLPGAATGIDDFDDPESSMLVLSAQPNPFSLSTRIRLDRRSLSETGIEIISAEGRIVRKLTMRSGALVNWNGNDGAGRALPSGVYYARIIGSATGGVRLVKVQ